MQIVQKYIALKGKRESFSHLKVLRRGEEDDQPGRYLHYNNPEKTNNGINYSPGRREGEAMEGRTGKSEKQVGDEASLLSVKTTTAYLNALSQTTGPRGET